MSGGQREELVIFIEYFCCGYLAERWEGGRKGPGFSREREEVVLR